MIILKKTTIFVVLDRSIFIPGVWRVLFKILLF